MQQWLQRILEDIRVGAAPRKGWDGESLISNEIGNANDKQQQIIFPRTTNNNNNNKLTTKVYVREQGQGGISVMVAEGGLQGRDPVGSPCIGLRA